MPERPAFRANFVQRLMVRVLARRRGEVKALADLLELRGLLRFVTVFALTIIAPGLTLAYFGYASIQGEALSARAEVQERADSMADGLSQRVEELFEGFESATRRRLESGRSPVESLRELSPQLVVAFRLDASGALAAPFATAPLKRPLDQTFFLSSPWQDAVLAEQTGGDPARAAQLYAHSASLARGIAERGQAEFARGRALMKAGLDGPARDAFANVVADYGGIRDVHGFRLGDLAQLKRGELLQHSEPVIGTHALQSLVDELLAARWTIGRGGEMAIAGRALELLEDNSGPDKDWIASARGRLEEKRTQLFWAEVLSPDLQALTGGGSMLRVAPGAFTYRRIEDTLWATTWWGDDFYAFALRVGRLRNEVDRLAHATNRGDSELIVGVTAAEREDPHALSRRSLAPWLSQWSLVVAPADPEALERGQRWRRNQRLLVIALSVFMIATGAVSTAWLINRELDVARLKSDFAANVSHELRSPITQIRLKGESLMFGLVSDDRGRQKHYEAIVREAERLSRLVDNVLDFAAIERGAKKYTFRPVDIGDTVRSAVNAARYAMETREMEFEVDIPDDLPVMHHDPEAVGQVVHNLISNAAKYGSDGGWIGVTGRFTPEGAVFEVRDRGIGILPEDLPRIFEDYFRSNSADVRRRKGTGIGLTIVKYIMEAHGGAITVESEQGQGTCFRLLFPLRPPEPPGP